MEPVLVSTQVLTPTESQVKDCISWLSWKPRESARSCDSSSPSTSSCSSSSPSTTLAPRLSSARRLRDCIEVLESMEKDGRLKMREIKHSKFYNACKKHKAVKEAFRFTNLIKKPSLSHFNQLMAICALAKDLEGAFEVLHLVKRAGLKADHILYTTLISACAKAGNIDRLFQVFHEMGSNGVEPNVNTYGALIDGCARAGQVGKAFGVYGLMRSKKVKPDQVIFNSLITACGRAGALQRAFDVLFEMSLEPSPILPNHVTLGALIKACSKAGQVDKALEVFAMMEQNGIEGSIEVYTEAVHACSITADLDSALRIYEDLKKSSIQPDQVFFSALIDVAGHAGKIDVCFDFLFDMKLFKLVAGPIVYGSLTGACLKTGNWQKALDIYRDMQTLDLSPDIPTMNALLTALCDGGQLREAKGILQEMRKNGLGLNAGTYAILFRGCEQASDIEFAFDLHKCATSEGVVPTVDICESIIGLCLQHVWKLTRGSTPTSSIGTVESVSFCGRCTSWALSVYRRAVAAGFVPTMKMFSQLLGCLRLPSTVDDSVLYNYTFTKHGSSDMQPSLIEGFGVYDPRALALFEEAAAIGIVPTYSYTAGPIVIDTSVMPVFVAEVGILTVLKGIKHRFAAGAKIPSLNIILAVKVAEVAIPDSTQQIHLISRTSQAVAGLLRKLDLNFRGHESSGKLRVPALSIENWLRPRPSRLPVLPLSPGPQASSLAKKIVEQQRMLRYAESSTWSPLSSPHCNGTDSIPPQLSHVHTNNKDAHAHHPISNGVHVLDTKDADVHHPVSNGVHVLDAIKGGELMKVSSAMEGVLSS